HRALVLDREGGHDGTRRRVQGVERLGGGAVLHSCHDPTLRGGNQAEHPFANRPTDGACPASPGELPTADPPTPMPGARMPGARMPGARMPGARMPGCRPTTRTP